MAKKIISTGSNQISHPFVKILNQIFFGKLYNIELIARIKCNPLYKTTLRIYRRLDL